MKANKEQMLIRILGALNELFDEQSENHITWDAIEEDPNAFILSLGDAIHMVYQKVTSDEGNDRLGFTHILQRLIMQQAIDDNSNQSKSCSTTTP